MATNEFMKHVSLNSEKNVLHVLQKLNYKSQKIYNLKIDKTNAKWFTKCMARIRTKAPPDKNVSPS